MSQVQRREVSEQEYVEEQVRSLQLQLATSKGQTQGALAAGMKIHTHASDVEQQLVSMGQARGRLLRDNQLMFRAIVDLAADIAQGRDAVEAANHLLASLALQGIVTSGAIGQALAMRPQRGTAAAPPPDVPAAVSVPRTEREYWQDIADALNAATATGRPVGIDVDGTLTDHFAWSVVWDRQDQRWVVGGYEDLTEGSPPRA